MSNLKTQNGLDFILLNKDFKNAYQFANEELKVYLDSIIDSIKNNIKLEHKRYLNIKDEYNKYLKENLSNLSIGHRIIEGYGKTLKKPKKGYKITFFIIYLISIFTYFFITYIAIKKWSDFLIEVDSAPKLLFYVLLGFGLSLGYIFVTYILKFIAIPLTEGNLTSFYKVEPIKTFHEFSDNETHNNFTETEKLDTIRKYILSNQRSKDFWESGFSKKD